MKILVEKHRTKLYKLEVFYKNQLFFVNIKCFHTHGTVYYCPIYLFIVMTLRQSLKAL